MDLGGRIKKLRKELDLTQQEFSARLRMKRNSIAQIEGGRNTSDQTVRMICREFNVSEEWLRTGVGEIFEQTAEDPVARLCEELHATKLDAEIIRAYFKIDERIREPFMRQLLEQVHAPQGVVDAEKPTTTPAEIQAQREHLEASEEITPSVQHTTDLDIEAEVEAYRQRLVLEKKQVSQTSAAKERGAG